MAGVDSYEDLGTIHTDPDGVDAANTSYEDLGAIHHDHSAAAGGSILPQMMMMGVG